MKRSRTALVLAAALGLSSCGSTGLGRVPDALVGLYDQAKPDGVIEIEIDRDGVIREMEAEIAIDRLPDRVRKVALERRPGAQIVGAEREVQLGGTFWEVQMLHQGRRVEMVLDSDGAIHETERELRREEAPQPVFDAVERALPGGTFESVEVVERADATEYHVKKTRDGARYKLVIAPNGRLVRLVREARAEIEIPLR
jgi:hypothetical protein